MISCWQNGVSLLSLSLSLSLSLVIRSYRPSLLSGPLDYMHFTHSRSTLVCSCVGVHKRISAYEFVLTSSAVSCISCSSNSDSLRWELNGRTAALFWLFLGTTQECYVLYWTHTHTHTHTHTNVYIYIYIYNVVKYSWNCRWNYCSLEAKCLTNYVVYQVRVKKKWTNDEELDMINIRFTERLRKERYNYPKVSFKNKQCTQ